MESKKAKENILNSFHENKNSHAFLIETNNINECLTDVIDIARQIECEKDGDDNCSCKICNLIRNNNNPDVVILKRLEKDDKEEEKIKDISLNKIKKDSNLKLEFTTKQIDSLISLFRTTPLVSKKQIYIIFESDKLNRNAANKLLKFLEEPNPNIIGFFITDAFEKMISTIVSRCEIYNFRYGTNNVLSLLDVTDKEFEKYYDTTMKLLYDLEHNKKYELILNSKNISKKERDDIVFIVKLIKRIYTIKFENIVYNYYDNLEFAEPILKSVESEDISLISKRILLLEEILSDLNRNSIRDMSINKLFIKWV